MREARTCIVAAALLGSVLAAPRSGAGEAAPGLLWVRFNSDHFTRPLDTGVAGAIDVDTGTDFNDYSQVWQGLIELPVDRPITFSAEADNGLRLYLDDRLVINGWGEGTARHGRFRAQARRRVPLRLEYYQRGGIGFARLYWHWAGRERELVPASAFFHTATQKEHVRAMHQGTASVHRDRSIIYQPDEGVPGPAGSDQLPVPGRPGPHLLLDDFLIAEARGVERIIQQPRRDASVPNPIVTGPEDGCFQPFFTVLRDSVSGRYRIWYGASRDDKSMTRSRLATMESADGIHFERPHRTCDTPEIQFGSEVIDRGPGHPDPASRYVYSYWLEGGLRILASAGGFAWRPLVEGIVVPHDHDINSIDWDPLRGVYTATVSTYITGPAWSGQRRTTMLTLGTDLVHWEKPWLILTANDELDEGEIQFYAMEGYLTRGPLRIGMVKVLRDDLRASGTQEGSFGRAHTSLAWTRDGRNWVRDRAAFFEPDDDPAAWDHAHAWVDEQLVVDDQVYLYYGGYKQGHKMNRFEERQIGLVRMPLDRYVARRSNGDAPGLLTTVPIRLDATRGVLCVNADASGGSLRVQARAADSGEVLPGFGFPDCMPVTGDGLRQEVHWRDAALSGVGGRSVRLEFELRQASLFAVEFTGP